MKFFDAITDYLALKRSKSRLDKALVHQISVYKLVDSRGQGEPIAPYLSLLNEVDQQLVVAKESYESLKDIVMR